MPMKRLEFDVWITGRGDDDPIRVVIAHADMLVAEQAAPRYGLPMQVEQASMTWTTLWIWHALKRLGEYAGEWPAFKLEDCLGFEPVGPVDDQGMPGALVDPTQPAALTDSR